VPGEIIAVCGAGVAAKIDMLAAQLVDALQDVGGS
jgi:hypothetical protein